MKPYANIILAGPDAAKTLYLQTYLPADYTGPADVDKLGTTYLAYIRTDQVEELASLVKVKTSSFYTGVSEPVARALAEQVVPSFDLLSVADPTKQNGGSDASTASSSGGASKTREDAIIGVVSALGGIALLVLLFLLYRAYKRRQQIASNKRNSDPDPNAYIGERTPGRDFDQDSVGGQRRRSFYFAEDSLRQDGGGSDSAAGAQSAQSAAGWVSFGDGNSGPSAQQQQQGQDEEYWDYTRNGNQQVRF